MRLLIASDLHGSLESLRFLLGQARELQPDLLVLLGDLVYHGPRNPLPEGYAPAEVDLALLPFPVTENDWINADGLRIFASHGPHLPERPPLPGMPQDTVILRGHTHVPRGETLDGLHFWNPGSLSLPKGGSPRSYGLCEDGAFRVLDTHGREVLRHQPGGA